MLTNEAKTIATMLEAGRLLEARQQVSSLVGRAPEGLDEGELARAVVESLAENTVDAVTATMLWGHVAGTPGVLVHRVVNTLDAMIGHHSERYEHFGWAAARLDDAMNWIPAHVTALAVALAGPAPAREVIRITLRDAPQHPSPNGGRVEAAFAASLGISLGGANQYGERTENRGILGSGPPATVADIERAIRLSRLVSTAIAVVPLALSIGLGLARGFWPTSVTRTASTINR